MVISCHSTKSRNWTQGKIYIYMYNVVFSKWQAFPDKVMSCNQGHIGVHKHHRMLKVPCNWFSLNEFLCHGDVSVYPLIYQWRLPLTTFIDPQILAVVKASISVQIGRHTLKIGLSLLYGNSLFWRSSPISKTWGTLDSPPTK